MRRFLNQIHKFLHINLGIAMNINTRLFLLLWLKFFYYGRNISILVLIGYILIAFGHRI